MDINKLILTKKRPDQGLKRDLAHDLKGYVNLSGFLLLYHKSSFFSIKSNLLLLLFVKELKELSALEEICERFALKHNIILDISILSESKVETYDFVVRLEKHGFLVEEIG